MDGIDVRVGKLIVNMLYYMCGNVKSGWEDDIFCLSSKEYKNANQNPQQSAYYDNILDFF